MRASKHSLVLALAGAAVAVTSRASAADVELPRPVPTAKLTQQVGLTEIAVEYDCPAVAGRKIWGGAVPYDKPWTIGTNPAARIKFTRDVTVGDHAVPAGAYWLLAIPAKSAWTIVINKSAEPIASARDYRPELDVARLKVVPKTVPRRERLIFTFSELSDDRASLDLEWDTLRVSIPIQVNTTQQVLSSITGLDGTWRSFANAARYMLETKKDYDAGLKYVDEALSLKEDWYSMWIKGALLAAKGDYASATDWAERAHDLAQKVGNGAPLEADLTKAIAEWSKKAHRTEKESRALAKVGGGSGTPGSDAPASDAPAGEHAVAATAPPDFKEASDQEPAKAAPVDDPPLRRSRLRKR
jgi:DUF2911 family protein